MKKWDKEIPEVLATFLGIAGGMLLATGLLNSRPAEALVGAALILMVLGLFSFPRILEKPLAGSRIFKKRRLAEKKAII